MNPPDGQKAQREALIEGWVNVYPEGRFGFHETERDADSMQSTGRLRCILAREVTQPPPMPGEGNQQISETSVAGAPAAPMGSSPTSQTPMPSQEAINETGFGEWRECPRCKAGCNYGQSRAVVFICPACNESCYMIEALPLSSSHRAGQGEAL